MLGESREREVLAVNAQGKTREYQLRLRFGFRVHDGKGAEFVPPSTVAIQRDIAFNEAQVLAREAEEAVMFRDMQSDLVQQVLRRLAAAQVAKPADRSGTALMQLRADQLDSHLARGKLAPLYVVSGDEALLAIEAQDAIRSAARKAGFTERTVVHADGRSDWSTILGAAQGMSLFAERRILEIRLPGGKPGKDGGEALKAHAAAVSDDLLTIVALPRSTRPAATVAWASALARRRVGRRPDH